MEWKRSHLPSLTGTKNTKWKTTDVHISAAEYSIIKATGRFNTPVECWGCTNSPKYDADRFCMYRNFPNKRDPDFAEHKKQSIQ